MVGDVALARQVLAELYMADGQRERALGIYLQLQRPGLFTFIEQVQTVLSPVHVDPRGPRRHGAAWFLEFECLLLHRTRQSRPSPGGGWDAAKRASAASRAPKRSVFP